jgi:arginyl-tRNA synthetase
MVKGMSTRAGNIVFLEDVLNEAIALSKEKILEKGRVPESEIDEVARRVGVGAIIFGDLKSSRVNDFEFNWEDLLNFSGYTGPYVQYSYTRIKSIMRKSEIKDFDNPNLSLLQEEIEIDLIKELLTFPKVIQKAVSNDELYFLAKYAYSLSKLTANFHRFVNVLNAEEDLQKARIFLLSKVADTIKTVLGILGIQTVENM